ncbi:LuxR family transcriptional regulator [Streptacidiphilus melanogenes]|uniref:LuxR family transcriptional regulator n=1 Tax=Streptacidiphilus melanogenes TaxID=411235 RepID=UPI00126A616F|nr:LuxR family transcriptional regulator [Streptacidiphilus melanogenes]
MPKEICPEGLRCYEYSLKSGSIAVSAAPDCLLRLQMLQPLPGDPGILVPIPPDAAGAALVQAIEQAVLDRQAEIAGIRTAMGLYESVYSRARSQEDIPFTLLTGDAAIGAALSHAVGACTDELLTVQPGGGRPTKYLEDAIERDLVILGRGVRQRTLYQHSVRAHAPTLAYVEKVTEAGAEVRTVPEIYDRLIICDESVAFIPTSDNRAAAALEIRQPALIRFLRGHFDRQWEEARPFGPIDRQVRSEAVVEDVQLNIARLLVHGFTDEAIARRLGLSRRTVATRVSQLSQQLGGSSSRAQLGYLIALQGILDTTSEQLDL